MKNLIIGFILGFALTLPISAIAFSHDYTDFQKRVVELLELIERHGEDINSDTETLINAVSRLPQG